MAGGNRKAGKASEMLFDCSASYWPDASADEYLVYTWSLDKVGPAAGSTTLAQALDLTLGLTLTLTLTLIQDRLRVVSGFRVRVRGQTQGQN